MTDLVTKFAEWKSDPVMFVMEACKATPDPWQAEALWHLAEKPPSFKVYKARAKALEAAYAAQKMDKALDLAKTKYFLHKRLQANYRGVFGKVSVRSGHGVGKSAIMAWGCLWMSLTHFPQKTALTSPARSQMTDVVWAEVSLWYRKMPKMLQDQLELTGERMVLKGREKESFASVRTSRSETPEALAGIHSENVLFLIDEASGIPDLVFETAEGALSTPESKILMCSNPTRSKGYFFDTHTRVRHLWHTMAVSCFEATRVSAEYIEAASTRYGEDSNRFRVRVLGEFPAGDDDSVMPLDILTEAVGRDVSAIDQPIIWGLDVARFGDDRSALAIRQGNVLLEPIKHWRNKDTMQLSGIITALYMDSKHRPDEIMVDVIGLGAGVVDRLRENGLPVRGVNVAESPSAKEKYFRLRDELWFRCRDWFFARDCRIPEGCDDLISELVQPAYETMSSGKLRVESKSEVKKRVLNRASPDLADAFVLTFASNRMRHRSKGLNYPKLRVA